MAGMIIKTFMGEIPMLNKRKLPDGAAATASNTKLINGDLKPWKMPSTIVTPSKVGVKKTIHKFGESLPENQYWFTWTTDVDVVRAPIDGDTTERTYFTGDGYPKATNAQLATSGGTDYPVNAYRLGVPVPDVTMTTFDITGDPTSASDAFINAAYVFTYITGWGEESMPSAPVGIASFKPGQAVNISNIPGAPTGNYNITGLRMYRSNTGNTGTQYQYVNDLVLGTSTYSDSALSSTLGETVGTWGWEMPPENGFGLTLGANGNAIMLQGRTIFPCIPFIMYAYPPEYQQSVESDLVGAGAFGQSFAILTKSYPYILSGIDPASYSMQKLSENQACVSKRSIVEMLGGVIYASPDGLWMIDGNGMRSLTKSLMTRDEWQAFKPESIHACQLDGRYFMWYDTGTKQGLVIFDFAEAAFLVVSDQYCTAAYNNALTDSLYIAQGSDIKKWDAGAAMTYTWRSKDYRASSFANYGYAKVEADSYPVTFKLYTDGDLVHTETVENRMPFRLPDSPCQIASIEITGSSIVTMVAVAETGEEINSI